MSQTQQTDTETGRRGRGGGTDEVGTDGSGDDGLSRVEGRGMGLQGLEAAIDMAEVEMVNRRPLHRNPRFLPDPISSTNNSVSYRKPSSEEKEESRRGALNWRRKSDRPNEGGEGD